MGSFTEPSSSISFTSSSHASNGSPGNAIHGYCGSETETNFEINSLSKLSSHLEELLLDTSSDFTDAEFIVEGMSICVHRCILAARSKFFCDLFKGEIGSSGKRDKKPKYHMANLMPYGKIGYVAFTIFLNYLYTGKLKPYPPEVSTCVDSLCTHDSCRPAIDFAVELMYASAIFQVPELVLIFQRRLLNFVGKALVEDVIPILMVAFHSQSSHLLSQCVDRVARSDLESIFIQKEVPFEVAENVKTLRLNFQKDDVDNVITIDPLHEKSVKKIHRALDSDDIELVKLLLNESNITLDEAYALHYAVAYCDPKVVSEVLNRGLANVNLRSSRGHTVLHIAARRKEPSIIVSLLNKGACASDITFDGQSAVSICRRLTTPKDYHAKTEQGKKSNNDRVCIDVLEREMHRNLIPGDSPLSLPIMAEDINMNLVYLENRVAFARVLFPTEAKVAMEIAESQTASEFSALFASKGMSGNLRAVDLNETPLMQNKRLLEKVKSLSKTVELGQRYFPHCSQVLDKFMEDDLPDLFYLEKGTPEEKKIKKARFMELKDEVQRAFNKDKAELHRSGLSSSSSSSSFKDGLNPKKRKM